MVDGVELCPRHGLHLGGCTWGMCHRVIPEEGSEKMCKIWSKGSTWGSANRA